MTESTVPDALVQRFTSRAHDAGLLDLTYTRIDSPVGSLLLVASDVGLLRVAFGCEDHDRILDELAARVSPRVLRAPARLEPVVRELDAYFVGSLTRFTVPLDFSLSTGFREQVQRFLPAIGYGETRSYKDVAIHLGNPGAVRAVGSACATNPLPVIVPCHRVLRTDGSLGGYLGGLPAKRTLLQLEGRLHPRAA